MRLTNVRFALIEGGIAVGENVEVLECWSVPGQKFPGVLNFD